MVEFSPATRETGVRFPANARHVFLLSFDDRLHDTLKRRIVAKCKPYFYCNFTASIGGSVVEFSPATREARVQFPADAHLDSLN